jgi:tetratricopeptide (TPR) repeat protein
VDSELLGHILREQRDPGCVPPYQEAAGLYQRIGARQEEGTVAFNLGHAYIDIPALRDLGQAEHWYQRAGDLYGEHDTIRRAQVKAQLGNVAYERFNDARKADADDEEQLRYLNAAARAYHQALSLFPDDAINQHAVSHNALGGIYGAAGDISRALGHYQKSIQYHERQDDIYSAGWSRYNAALDLARAEQDHDALLYARAALRDFETVGPGAAAFAGQARQLIARLEQDPTP